MEIFKRHDKFQEEEIIKILEAGGEQENQVLKYLYTTHYGSIRQLVVRQGGSEQEAEDIFQEALITFYEQVKNGRFTHTAKIKTYLFAVAKNNWMNKLKRKNRQTELKAGEWYSEKDTESSPSDVLHQQEVVDFAKSIIAQLGTDCQKMLDLSLYRKLAMKEIAVIMNYGNAQVARNKKHKCLEQLKKIILKSAKLNRLAKELKNE